MKRVTQPTGLLRTVSKRVLEGEKKNEGGLLGKLAYIRKGEDKPIKNESIHEGKKLRGPKGNAKRRGNTGSR